MAVSTVTPLPPPQPDISKLNTFTGHTITVTQHTGPRNTMGKTVVPPTTMRLQQILELMTSIPLQYGSGFYLVKVDNSGGTGSVEWMTKLGPDIPEVTTMAGPLGTVPPGGPQQPLSEGVRVIGRGYTFDETLGLLATPWGELVQWRSGEPLPKPPSAAAGAGLSLVPPNASPWNWPPQQAGWGGFPANDDARVKALEAQLAEESRRRDAEAQRAEMRRLVEEMQRRQDDTNKMFMTALEKLSAKPVGPSDEMVAMRAQLEEERRRREESEREARHRAEMHAQNEKFDRAIREMTAGNKQDPMLPLIMQLITSAQQSAAETVKAIQASTTAAAGASERNTQELARQLAGSVMSPMQIVQMMQQSKGDGAEAARMIVETAKTSMAMQSEVYARLLDAAGQGDQPAWVSVATTALDKISVLGAALAERNAQAQAAAAAQAQQAQHAPARAPIPQGPMANPAQARRAVGAAPVVVPSGPVVGTETGGRPDGTTFEKKSETFVLADGRRIHTAYVQQWGWKEVLSWAPGAVPDEKVIAGVPLPSVYAAPVTAAPPVATTMSGAAPAKKRGRPKKATEAPPTPYSIDEMREMDPVALFELLTPFDDAWMFDVLMPWITELRTKTPAPPPEKVAEFVLEGQAKMRAMGKAPPAMELLEADQFDVLVHRMLPNAPEPYRAGIVSALEDAMSDDEDDEEEDNQ